MVFRYDDLYAAWREASKGKLQRENQARYLYYLEDRLFQLQEKLNGKTFTPSPMREKEIFIPKYRIAQVPSLEDKIVQHLICDNYVHRELSRHLVVEASACLIGRGDDYAIRLLKKNLRKHYLQHGKHFYVLKCDIHSYFPSIKHDRVRMLIDRYIADEDVKRIMLQFIDLTEEGLPLGLQQSQLLANIYLSELDHKLKEKFHVKLYGRHMDDFYIISDDYGYLWGLWDWIDNYVRTVGLDLNPKTDIFADQFDFLGFTFKLSDTGRVITRLVNSKKRTQRHRLRLQVRQLSEGLITPKQLEDSYSGWRAHALRGNCKKMVFKTDMLLNKMLQEHGYFLVIFRKNKVKICQEQLRS